MKFVRCIRPILSSGALGTRRAAPEDQIQVFICAFCRGHWLDIKLGYVFLIMVGDLSTWRKPTQTTWNWTLELRSERKKTPQTSHPVKPRCWCLKYRCFSTSVVLFDLIVSEVFTGYMLDINPLKHPSSPSLVCWDVVTSQKNHTFQIHRSQRLWLPQRVSSVGQN